MPLFLTLTRGLDLRAASSDRIAVVKAADTFAALDNRMAQHNDLALSYRAKPLTDDYLPSGFMTDGEKVYSYCDGCSTYLELTEHVEELVQAAQSHRRIVPRCGGSGPACGG